MPTESTAGRPLLLAVVELGGYPSFASLYEAAGYEYVSVLSVRKALTLIKQRLPAVVVCEFNFQSDFRDRTSSLESLLAVLQRQPGIRVIVFHEAEHAAQLARLTARFPVHATLAYPIDPDRLRAVLA
jgi:DNA-binding NtrC family response regulator